MRVLLVVYDNGSYIHWFPIGIAYIAAVLKNQGIEVDIYQQDQHHYPDAHLTDFLNKNKYDVLGYSTVGGYYQYNKLIAISKAINRAKNRPFFILGGHGPSPEPKYFLKKTNADAIVIGEGEETVIELIDAISNKSSLSKVRGIAYRNGDLVKITPSRPLIKDVDSIPFPAYDLFPIEYYRLLRMPHTERTDFVMPILSSRGCKFKCNFCYRLDKGFRIRSNGAIIEEIKMLKKQYGINYIAFADELLMSSIQRTESLCKDLIAKKINIKWECNGRLNYATKDLLKLMKESGCVFINYGIESLDDKTLKIMRKNLTSGQIKRGVENTIAAGISPGLNIIFGNIGENEQTLEKGVNFLLEHDDFAQMRTIRPVTGYPGTELFEYAIRKGLLSSIDEFYEKLHVNSDLLSVNYTELTDEEFNQTLYEANCKLLSNYFENKKNATLKQAKHLYLQRDANFRGFRQT